MKFFKVAVVSFVLSGSLYALPFVDVEAGGLVGVDIRGSLDSAGVGASPTGASAGGQNGSLATISLDTRSDYRLAYGVYGRAWLGGFFKFAPFVKWEASKGIRSADVGVGAQGEVKSTRFSFDTYNNIQYGALFGLEVPLVGLLPYFGASYSQFVGESNFVNTYAINYGVKWAIPLIPLLTVGVDASYQRPTLANSSGEQVNLNRLSLTIGLEI